MKKKRFLHSFFVFAITLLLISCATPTGLQFSPSSESANALVIAEAQTLLSKSSESYNSHAAEVDSLKAHID
ncbi:MAG: hypothetical protein ABIS01_06540, partial [Ferruginibacter sp.]